MRREPLGFSWKALVLGLALVAVAGCEGETRPVHFAADGPVRDERLIMGVGVHFGIGGEYGYDQVKTAERIKDLGLDSYRDDLPWSLLYREDQGAPGQRPRRLYNFMTERAAPRPVLILGHPNPEVPGGSPPLEDAAQTAFAKFAADGAVAMKPFNAIYEVWNEWNMNAVRKLPWLTGAGDPSDPRAAVHYAALARKANKAIADAVPGATILSGAVGVDNDWVWTKAIVNLGALENASGLSVHLYNHCEADKSKRTATELADRVSVLQDFMRGWNGGKDYPIYVTEFGWPTVEKMCIITPESAANNASQFFLWASATPWLKGAWVYELKNSIRGNEDLESGFGLYDYDFNPKPGACAVKETAALIKAARSIEARRPFPDFFVLRLKGEGTDRIVAWTTDGAKTGSLKLGSVDALAAREICGATQAVGDRFEVSAKPLVIDLKPGTSAVELDALQP